MKTDTVHKQAIGYMRVSTVRQGESGVGFEGQLAAINSYAASTGYELVNVFRDVGSGRGKDNVRKRPNLLAAIEEAARLKVPIMVAGLDRLSREKASIEKLVGQHGLTMISASEGELNPIVLSSRAARAEREGELISERTTGSLRQKKLEGVQLGNRRNLDVAQTCGAASNRQRHEKIVNSIANVLSAVPARVTFGASGC